MDHIKPVAKGGGDDLSNLQPLQWQNNRKKGDDYPASDYCIVSAR
ncbi:MAG: HNH endonuclease [Bacteroidales bacterium]|nr:HNH endonuclease [Bacteroidales bacterium]